MKPFGELVKEALNKTDTSLKIKIQLQTNYIDTKYFMELAIQIKQAGIKGKLLNCLLISRHFMSILENKTPDFTDYTISKKTV